jgi:hypothetical protein
VPAVTRTWRIRGNPGIEQRLKGYRLIRPMPSAECVIEPFASPIKVVEMKLPEARPCWIIPLNRPWQLALLVQKVEADNARVESRQRRRKHTIDR